MLGRCLTVNSCFRNISTRQFCISKVHAVARFIVLWVGWVVVHGLTSSQFYLTCIRDHFSHSTSKANHGLFLIFCRSGSIFLRRKFLFVIFSRTRCLLFVVISYWDHFHNQLVSIFILFVICMNIVILKLNFTSGPFCRHFVSVGNAHVKLWRIVIFQEFFFKRGLRQCLKTWITADRAAFNWVLKVICVHFSFALLRCLIGSKNAPLS